MRIIPIIKRLKEEVALLEERVEPATDLMAIDDDEIITGTPICFVHALDEKSEESTTIGSVQQWGLDKFRLLMMADNINLETEQEPMEDLKDQVDEALLGWKMPGDYGFVEFVEGGVINISGDKVIWASTYKVERERD